MIRCFENNGDLDAVVRTDVDLLGSVGLIGVKMVSSSIKTSNTITL